MLPREKLRKGLLTVAKGEHDFLGRLLPPAVELMGRIVIVYGIYTRTEEGVPRGPTKKSWTHSFAVPRSGWVVGERWLQTGVHEFGSYDDPAVWTNTGPSFHCLLVSYWPTMKPVPVPFDCVAVSPLDFRYGCEDDEFRQKRLAAGDAVSCPRSSSSTWSEQCKRNQRKEMQAWPRNEKGHWKKWTDFTDEEKFDYKKGTER